MAKKKPQTIDVQDYYDVLRNEFLLGAKRSRALPHLGERGRNEEERVRAFLRRVLPDRFSVGSGFVISSKKDLGLSAQMDVIIYDQIHNAPIFREVADVYPVEMVYAVMEVKRVIQREDLPKILKDIQHVRALGAERRYVAYTSLPRTPQNPDQLVTGQIEFQRPDPKPRSYVVAFSQKGWADVNAFVADLRVALEETDTHIHGIVILDADWFVTLQAFSTPATGLRAELGNSLLRFVHNVMHSVASMPMNPTSIDRYLDAATPNQSLQRTRRRAARR